MQKTSNPLVSSRWRRNICNVSLTSASSLPGLHWSLSSINNIICSPVGVNVYFSYNYDNMNLCWPQAMDVETTTCSRASAFFTTTVRAGRLWLTAVQEYPLDSGRTASMVPVECMSWNWTLWMGLRKVTWAKVANLWLCMPRSNLLCKEIGCVIWLGHYYGDKEMDISTNLYNSTDIWLLSRAGPLPYYSNGHILQIKYFTMFA